MKVLKQTYISLVRFFSIATLTILLPASGLGQINFLVGYDIGYYPDHTANSIFEAHNEQTTWYKTPLESIDFQHGLHLGLRYGFESVRASLTYKNTGLRTEAEGIPTGDTESLRRSVRFRNNNLGFGLETARDYFNFGIALEYNSVSITGTNSQLSNNFEVLSDHFWSSRIFVNIEFYGDRYIGFAIQPYWSLSLTGYSLSPLGDELETGLDPDWSGSLFGCSFLMTNGPRY